MDKIQHRQVNVGKLNLHVAEVGSGPAVLFLHGFPEIWYTWRYQMLALANEGFHSIAPDFRGYGLSDQPPNPEQAKMVDLVEDMIALMDTLTIDQAFVVGHDFGALIAYYIALLYPQRVKAVVTLGIPYLRPSNEMVKVDQAPSGFYIARWQEPGRGLADFTRFDVRSVIRNVYTLFSSSEVPVAEEGKEIMDLYDPSKPLPPWFTEEDLNTYTSLYEKSGFVYPLQVPYQCLARDHGRLEDLKDYTINVPALLIMGMKDYVLKFPGMEERISSDLLKSDVPKLEIQLLEEGSHFIHEQFPDQVNSRLINFLNKHR
eukprot:TRINITY_DN32913_c0_g1_i1.p1 TRINITY_DN32913_c0_g1~~TRINITY_DN32913_c0_g1_i1.p1  ORF type:complete len:316 (-),score=62.35 TRINITY_DN32913_c0_g1_i1:294-1241(-)